MPKFSDELRKALRDAPLSRYEISQRTGVDQGTLSRFVSGEVGLSLESLDALAELLGWELAVRETKHGGKPKMSQVLTYSWKRVADWAAKDAGENNFPSRRGLYRLEGFPDGDAVVIYNNNPYRLKHWREEETESLRRLMKEKGLTELAYSVHPKRGPEAGYTYAMVVRGGDAEMDVLWDLVREVTQATARRTPTAKEQKELGKLQSLDMSRSKKKHWKAAQDNG